MKGESFIMKQEKFTAKTLEKAKELASQKFGVEESVITFKVLEEPKKFLGFKKGEYVIEATYIPQPEPQQQEVQTENVENSVAETVEETATEPVIEVAETVTDTQPLANVEQTPQEETSTTAEALSTGNVEKDVKTVESFVETQAEVEKSEKAETEESLPTQDDILEKAKVAQEYVGNILEKMGIDPTSEINITENGAIIDFKGDGTGTIIGKRGETLDALQYLSAMICNKGEKDYYRITLDSCGYRAKRKVILQELAQKVSKNVLKTGRSQSLEPMNPYERRIIHAKISEIDGVTSRSVGEEPFRKVIISSTNPKKYNNNRKKGGYNSRGNNNNKYRKNGKRKPYQPPRSLDLKTSFEKDYRKPKPEDNLKEGLYGKIEI
jgi:spoIIIJ-associated protein